jgi:thiamine-phosphate pyrophosphorylase
LPPSPKRQLWQSPPKLYAIIDAEVCARHDRAPLDVARAFLAGGARLLQLRCKSMPSGEFLDLAIAVVEAAHTAGATTIINDRADIAALSGAPGLHVGQEDLTPADARRVIGDTALLGLSTHTKEQWDSAVREPISYMAIGPVFGSGTKATGYAAIGLETVRQAAAAAVERGLPTVAIGGITIDHARSVIDAGAASVAVISDLLNGDPEARVRAFLRILE